MDEIREAVFAVTFAPKSGGQLQPGAGPQGETIPEKEPPAAGDEKAAAGDAESEDEAGDAAEGKKLAAMVAAMSEGILAMQQTLKGFVLAKSTAT